AFVNLENQRPALTKAINTIEQSMNYLKNLLGLSIYDSIELSDSLNSEVPDFAAGEDTSAVSRRPDLLFNRLEQEAALQQLKSRKAAALPQLSLFSQYQLQTQADNFRFQDYKWPNSFYTGIQLTIPVFAGFKNDARSRQARIAHDQLLIQDAQLKKQAALEIRNAGNTMKEAGQRSRSQRLVIAAAQRSLSLINARFEQGLAKYSEVVDAEYNLAEAESNLLQAVYDYHIARASYDKSIGMQ
ncbi:MAG: TolC family protein, partial [Chitinophagaceae bacterium]|nr:TolC family protein [Chitinophagaceae bacterium]